MGSLEIDFEKNDVPFFLSSSHSITRTILDRIKTNKHLGQDRDQNLVHKLQMLLSKKYKVFKDIQKITIYFSVASSLSILKYQISNFSEAL